MVISLDFIFEFHVAMVLYSKLLNEIAIWATLRGYTGQVNAFNVWDFDKQKKIFKNSKDENCRKLFICGFKIYLYLIN